VLTRKGDDVVFVNGVVSSIGGTPVAELLPLASPASTKSMFPAEPEQFTIGDLPFPPSVNHYWLDLWNPKQKRIFKALTAEAKVFRQEVMLRVRLARPPKLKGFLRLEAVFYQPNRLVRDIDNLPKGLLDALKHAELFDDDSQIRELNLRFADNVVPGGRTAVVVSTLT